VEGEVAPRARAPQACEFPQEPAVVHGLEHGQARAFDERRYVLCEQLFGFTRPRAIQRVVGAGADFVQDSCRVLGQRHLLEQTFHSILLPDSRRLRLADSEAGRLGTRSKMPGILVMSRASALIYLYVRNRGVCSFFFKRRGVVGPQAARGAASAHRRSQKSKGKSQKPTRRRSRRGTNRATSRTTAGRTTRATRGATED